MASRVRIWLFLVGCLTIGLGALLTQAAVAHQSLTTSSGARAHSDPASFVLTTTVTLTLSAPFSVPPGGVIPLQWQIDNLTPNPLVHRLQIKVPPALTPAPLPPGATWVAATSTLHMPLSTTQGTINWQVAANANGPFRIQGLVRENLSPLAAAATFVGVEHLIGSNGGTIFAFNGRIVVQFPAGAFLEDAQVYVSWPAAAQGISPSLSGRAFEIVAHQQTNGQRILAAQVPFNVRMKYTESQIQGDEASLTLFFYEQSNDGWHPLPTQVRKTFNLLDAQTTQLSVLDLDTQDWQAARLPTLADFQVA
ncbi:MAG: hypothetical protein ACRDIB_05060, partial [Ardenticatenaceae bacterium]